MEVSEIPLDKIRPSPYQPRETFDKEKIQELSESIKSVGILEPIIVRQNGDTYQIIAGERRWRAAQFAGLKKIPAIIKDIAGEHMLEESLIENWHRQDLSPIERENAVYALWESEKYGKNKDSYAKLATVLGISPRHAEDNIKAKEAREEIIKVTKQPPKKILGTRAIVDTEGIDDIESRAKVISKVENKELKAEDIREYVAIFKDASQPVKDEMLKPESEITKEIAEQVIKLEDVEEQKAVVEEIKRYRLKEDEVKERIEDIVKSKEAGIAPIIERGFVIEGQWFVDRFGRISRELNTLNPKGVSDLTPKQKEQIVIQAKAMIRKLEELLKALGHGAVEVG